LRREDVGDYFALRRFAANPWETVRFRKTRRHGQTLAVQMRDGATLLLRGDSNDFHIFHRIYLRDEYRLARLPARLGCVIDLGANVGLFAARVAPRAERVICYEPVPANFAQLERNVAGFANVAIHREAVAGEAGTLRIYRPESDALSGRHSAFADVSTHMTARYDEVPARSLDEVFARNAVEACDLLKIDVEGSEYAILHGAGAATLARVARIHGEYHDVAPDDPRTRIDAFANFLRTRGYAVEVVPHPRKPNLGLFFAARHERAP
jgi:FkbM family methyltransferase